MTELEYIKKVEEITSNKTTLNQKIYELLQEIEKKQKIIESQKEIIGACLGILKIYGNTQNWYCDPECVERAVIFDYKNLKGHEPAQEILCKYFLKGE